MAKTGVFEGQDLIVFVEVEGTMTPIAHCTSHTLEVNTDVRDRLSKDTGRWKGKKAGLLGWTISVEALATYDGYGYHDLFDLQIAREPVTIKAAGRAAVDDNDTWQAEEVGDNYYEGKALISGLPMNAPNVEDATFTCNFEGDGELTKKEVTV
jgi:predicted secreted protein